MTITRPCRRYVRRVRRRHRRFRVSQFQVFACRRVAGTDTWSQHAWGNAVDMFAPHRRLDDLAHWTARNARRLKVRTVIWQDRYWSIGAGWRPYAGVPHTTHVHVDFTPHKTGTPPCAH